MNHAELIRRVARLEPTDRFPFALLSSGAWAIVRNGCSLEKALALPPAEVAAWLYDGYTKAGSAVSWVGSGYNNIVIRALGGTIKWRRKGTPDVVETLLGDAGEIDGIDLGRIAGDPDIRSVYETVRRLVALEGGERLVGGSMWGPFTIAGLLYGAENLMRGVGNKDAAVGRLLEFSSEVYLAYMQGYIDAGARVVFMAEPSASGDMISRRHFEGFVVPYIKEIYRRLSGQGLVVGLHICGDTSDRLDLIAESGAQIMSLDYKVDLAAAKKAFAGKIAFSGNLNPVDVVQRGTPEEVRAKTLEAIETVGTHSSYIVMPGCDIPPSTPLENLQAISGAADGYPMP